MCTIDSNSISSQRSVLELNNSEATTRKLQRFFAHFAFPLAQHIEEVQSIANRVSVPLKTALYDFIVGFIKSMTGWKGSRKTVKSAKVSVYDLNVGQKQFDFNSKQEENQE